MTELDFSLQRPQTQIDLATPLNMYVTMKQEKRAQRQDQFLQRQQMKAEKKQADLQDLTAISFNPETGALDRDTFSKGLADFGYIDELQKVKQGWREQDKNKFVMSKLQREDKQAQEKDLGMMAKSVLSLPDEQKMNGWEMMLKSVADKGYDVPEYWMADMDPYNQGQIKNDLEYLAKSAEQYKTGVDARPRWYNTDKGWVIQNSDGSTKYARDPESGDILQGKEAVKYISGDQEVYVAKGDEITGTGIKPKGYTKEIVDIKVKKSQEERDNEKWMAEQNRERQKKGLKKAGTDLAAKTVVQDMGRGMAVLEKNMKNGILPTTAAGPLGSLLKYIPSTDADILERYAESVKSNISIDRLQAMREASPTGGALGQVPVQQQEYLMQLLGSLDVGQKPSILYDNMKRIYNIYMDAIHGINNGPPRKRLSFDQEGVTVPGGVPWTGTEFIDAVQSEPKPKDGEWKLK